MNDSSPVLDDRGTSHRPPQILPRAFKPLMDYALQLDRDGGMINCTVH